MRILELRSDVGIEDDDVRTFPKALGVLAAYPPTKSYSGRRSSPESEGLLVFFIGLALGAWPVGRQ